jgi:acetyl-CoA C-acetyltransferase
MLAGFRAAELAGLAITEALRRAGIATGAVDQVVFGQALQAGQGQNPARQAAVAGGIPFGVPATTVNKVCLSGLHALHLADLMIQEGEADVVLAGGMESMTNAPYILEGARRGYGYGDSEVFDSIQADGLRCAFERVGMGVATEVYAEKAGISREFQDEIALLSHQRAATAREAGRLSEELVAVSVPQRRGPVVTMDADEGIRPETTLDALTALKPAFSPTGSITAGNSSQISDGAAALVLMSQQRAAELGVAPLGSLLGFGQVAGPDPSLLTQPSRAVRAAIERCKLSLGQVEIFEINEAFGAVVAASMDDLGVSSAVVNVNGGAIALGHPIGMTGARLVLSLAYELRRRGGGIGAVALCGGGGQGEAALLQVTGANERKRTQ